jgi:hypothetical protein
MNTFDATRAIVRGHLEETLAAANEALDLALSEATGRWTLQGFGMLRCYFPGDWRLNVWDSKLRVRGVSLVHDHPWHFESLVLNGSIRNVRFAVDDLASRPTHRCSKLKPGPGGGLLDANGRAVPLSVRLVEQPPERYERGATYSQVRNEVHLSDPADGCVTLNRRFERLGDDVARVFWPIGESWVSAEPRSATAGEVKQALEGALSRWY